MSIINDQRYSPKAVIFTHFGSLKFGNSFEEFYRNSDILINEYIPILRSYLECNNKKNVIQIVYGYIDWGVRNCIQDIKITNHNGRKSFSIDASVQEQERALIGILQSAEQSARRQLEISPSAPPKFEYIGIPHLISLLNNLIEVEPSLLKQLSGDNACFTYDSPKFVESIIRLARGDTPHLAVHPIIRIDEDAIVNTSSIVNLLNAFRETTARHSFFYFSGRYGRHDNMPDPINNHAVRVHWFYPTGTVSGDPKFKNNLPEYNKANKISNKFLSDLSLLGATQILPKDTDFSTNAKALLESGKLINNCRKTQQVVSGAGLIMARRAVRMLPPFMNFNHLTTWVDDHLKRRLHEMFGDITSNDIESVKDVIIQQDRHSLNTGTTLKDCGWAKSVYFDRLLRGCIMHVVITSNDMPTNYSLLLKNIAWGKVNRVSKKEKDKLCEDLKSICQNHYDKVLYCWSSLEYKETVLMSWVQKIQSKTDHKERLCTEVIEDALSYIDLLLNWQIFTCAVERLSFVGNRWLYEEVD